MYHCHLPVISSAVLPTTTVSCTSPVLINTFTPKIVYESKLTTVPLLYTTTATTSHHCPIIGYNCLARISADLKKEDEEKKLDEIIKEKVEHQIKKYDAEEKKIEKEQQIKNEVLIDSKLIEPVLQAQAQAQPQAQPQPAVLCCCRCNCVDDETKLLTLDEKIAKIRKELNLPSEREQDQLIKRLHDYQKRYEEIIDTRRVNWDEDYYNRVEERCNCKELREKQRKINYIRSRTRSISAENKSRSSSARSKSPISRPPWIPTGSNDYTSTHNKRVDLILNQRNNIYSDSEPRNSLVFFEHHTNKPDHSTTINYVEPKSTVYQVDTIRPAKTIVTTTVDSKSTYKTNPSYLSTTNYVTDPCFIKTSSSEPYYHQRTIYPLSNQYYYQPISRSKSSINLNPIDKTPHGTLFTSGNNEIHYVSDKARNNLSRSKTAQIKISNTGSTIIHE